MRYTRSRRRGLGVLGSVGIALVLGAGPVGAHEGTTSTTVSPGATPTALPAATHEAATATAEAPDRSGSQEFRVAYALAVLAVTGAAALGLRVALPLLKPGSEPRFVDSAASAALVFSGVAHLFVAPPHWVEGRHLGVFFTLSSALLLGQGAAVWLRPSAGAYRSVVVSTGAFIVLYFLARELSLPLVGHRDPYAFEEYPVKLAEGVAAMLAAVALVRTRPAAVASRLAAP